MIDGILVRELVTGDDFWGHPTVVPYTQDSINDATGVLECQKVSWFGLKVDRSLEGTSGGQTKLKGSLHKFWDVYNQPNSDLGDSTGLGKNWSDFGFSDVVAAVNILGFEHWGVEKSILNGLEFGVNINTGSVEVEKILNSLVSYRGKPFNVVRSGNKHFCQAETQNYNLKVYDKGLQYRLDQNLIRVEIRVKRMSWIINQIGLDKNVPFTLGSLKEFQIYPKLLETLLGVWNDVVMDCCEGVTLDSMSPKDREDYLKLSNPSEWSKIPQGNTGRVKRYRNKIRLSEIIENHQNSICFHELLGIRIKEKWDSLMVV